ncbi:MAG: hypothetical protein EOO17_03500 [Chloroflexi bacterium]|nr:MAG: hypothetical protein EOO17_03500 [Chloroflexota bacterium]
MSIYRAQTIDGQTTHGTVHLSKLNPGDVVTVITENSRHTITVTDRFEYSIRLGFATGVEVQSTNSDVETHSNPVLNKVTEAITLPSKICINMWQTSFVKAVLINDRPLDAYS